MTRDEYEDRKRQIEDQHRLGVELLEAGRRLQLRTLEILWRSGLEDALGPAPASPSPSPYSIPIPTVPVASAPPSKPKRRPSFQVYDDVVAALERVPEEFTRDDVLAVLDYVPDRAVLHRVLIRLVEEDHRLHRVERGTGRLPSRYRKRVP